MLRKKMYSKYLLDINENNILNLVAGDNYIIVNRTLIKNLGLKEAVILGELASEFNYYKKNNSLDENGYFYSTIENIEENTGLSRSQQKTVLDKLKKLEIIDVIIKGIPAKRYVKINAFKLISQYAEKLQTSLLKIDKLECQKLTTKNNNNNNNKKEIYKESIEKLYFENNKVNDIFLEFLDLRKKIKAVNSDRAINTLINKLNKYDDDTKFMMIEQSIVNSWKDVYELKNKQSKKEDDNVEWF